MSSLFSKCCCTGDCFWGYSTLGTLGEDFGYCLHNTTERLHLRIPRPAFTTTNIGTWTRGCSCSGSYTVINTATGASDIIARYAHFAGETTSRLYHWKWYDPSLLIPTCVQTEWGWDGASPAYSDERCCDDPTSTTECPSDFYNPFTFGGGSSAIMSNRQQYIIQGTPVPVRDLGVPSSLKVCSTKDYGDGWRWLDGIADYETGLGGDRFKRWWYISGSGWEETDFRRLVETMFVVLHRTKWWERDYNSESGTAGSCRTPEYWDYECAGFPIYTWEVKNAPSSVLSETEKQNLFIAADAGDPMDQSSLDKLVAHLGCEPQDHSQSSGKNVRRTLVDRVGGETTHYGFSREAGWLSVCYDKDTSGKFPQWATDLTACTSPPLPNGTKCFTAGPFPQSTTCSAVAGSGPGTCEGESGCGPASCSPIFEACDFSNQPLTCAQDSAIGDCSGIWFHFNQYGPRWSPDDNATYSCNIHNEAFLCVVPNALTVCDCEDFPFYGPNHLIPPLVSRAMRDNGNLYPPEDTGLDSYCSCGGRGTALSGTKFFDCCTVPNRRVCQDPDNEGLCSEVTP